MPYTEVMHKWKKGNLHSGSKEGPVVTKQKQAVAIMLSEKRAAQEGKKEYQPKKYQDGGDVEGPVMPGGLGTAPTTAPYDKSPPAVPAGKLTTPGGTSLQLQAAPKSSVTPTRTLNPQELQQQGLPMLSNRGSGRLRGATAQAKGGPVKKYQGGGSTDDLPPLNVHQTIPHTTSGAGLPPLNRHRTLPINLGLSDQGLPPMNVHRTIPDTVDPPVATPVATPVASQKKGGPVTKHSEKGWRRW